MPDGLREAIQGKEGVIDPAQQGLDATGAQTGVDPAGATGADGQGGGEGDGELGQPEGGDGEGGQQDESTGEFVLNSVAEERLSRAQSKWMKQVNERENRIRELEAQIAERNQTVPPQTQSQQPDGGAEARLMSDQDFVERLNRQDGTALKTLTEAIRQDAQALVQQEIQSFTQKQQQEAQVHFAKQQYVSQMDAMCAQAGLTDQERQYAESIALESRDQSGLPQVSPQEAIVIARFGSFEKAIEFANAQRDAAMAAGGGMPPAGAQPGATPAGHPARPTPPPVPGGTPGHVPTPPDNNQPIVQERGWRGTLG